MKMKNNFNIRLDILTHTHSYRANELNFIIFTLLLFIILSHSSIFKIRKYYKLVR